MTVDRSRIDFGRRIAAVQLTKFLSLRTGVRTIVVCAVLAVLAFAFGIVAIGTGDFQATPSEVLAALAGDGPRAVRLVVVEWRLPRILLALAVGAALGAAGAIFQGITRNPLGSPDIMGFTTGAYTGALIAIMFFGREYYQTAAGALVGGIVVALVVYILAYKNGVHGFRLIIVGIAISALLSSVNQWFIIRADLQTAIAATIWGQGSLNGLGWEQATPVFVALFVVGCGVAALGPRLAMLEMGDDAATALGVRAEPTRLLYLVVGVALTAIATAAVGPISFVALAAPQIARRLTRTAGIAIVPAAVTGAALLLMSDWLAQRIFSPTQLPVGVVTVSLGGVYFVWLLMRETRK